MKSFTNMSDLQRLAFDCVNGKSRDGLSNEQLNEAVKEAIRQACGGEWNYRNFMKNKHDVFALIEEIIPIAMHSNLIGKFEEFADFHDTTVGDDIVFKVESNELYPIYVSSRGNQDIERHKITDRTIRVITKNVSIKYYEELDWLLSGRMDLARMVEIASSSMSNYVGELISNTVYNSYSSVGTNYKTTGTFDASTLNTMVEHVKAANNVQNVQIFGTTTALSNIVDAFGYSDGGKDRANSWGYYGEFRGSSLIALPQAYTAGSFGTFHVDTNHFLILPVGKDKIIKILAEGNPFMNMTDPTDRNDMQTEVFLTRRLGASALTVNEGRYGFYKLS